VGLFWVSARLRQAGLVAAEVTMRFGPYDDLPDDHRDTLKRMFDASFGRIAATPQQIGALIKRLGWINRLLGKN